MKATVRDWLEPSEVLWPDPSNGPWSVELAWAEHDGRAACVGVSLSLVKPAAVHAVVNATLWRSLPIGTVIADARRLRFDATGGVLAGELSDNPDPDGTWRDHFRRTSAPWAEAQPGRPVDLQADHYRAVAAIYSTAHAEGRPPLQAVSAHWSCSRPTASRWVARARELELLPATERGRARGNAELVARDVAEAETTR
ncbi:hypothetical protein acdb102_15850 [Acidothermaceae bacterium B102]|nr:hypothetical protein acdb102_15850 [Acidothermaceae bacterium B102]